ncbi:MAG: hypothetical protein QXP51_05175 [Candidatus Hadarchaeales archaeon]
MTLQEAVSRIKSMMRLPDVPSLVDIDTIQKSIDQALIKLNQRTGGKYVRSPLPTPGMRILRDPVYDPVQVYAIPFGGSYEGLEPWTLDNIDTVPAALRYFLDLAVEYLHLNVAGKLAIADGLTDLPFQLEFRSIYDQAVSRVQEIDRDLQDNWLIPVL